MMPATTLDRRRFLTATLTALHRLEPPRNRGRARIVRVRDR